MLREFDIDEFVIQNARFKDHLIRGAMVQPNAETGSSLLFFGRKEFDGYATF